MVIYAKTSQKKDNSVRIEVITTWYNEAFLAPFFLRHYDFVDKIHLLFDEDTNDGTLAIVENHPKVVIHPFRFPDGMDDEIKVERINMMARRLNCDWVFNVDADEFIFALPKSNTVRDFLSKEKSNVVIVKLFQVYRHITDEDLDINKSVMEQRRHGDTTASILNSMYNKPIVIKPSKHVAWAAGNHKLQWHDSFSLSKKVLFGSHWAMADPELAVQRRYYGRTLRQSQRNKTQKLSCHLHNLTPEIIMDVCQKHQNDPVLFEY